MLEARKDNKCYTISETEIKVYLSQGFDIYKDGKVLQYADTKVIKYNEHVKVVAEKDAKIAELEKKLEALKAEIATLKAESASTKKGK